MVHKYVRKNGYEIRICDDISSLLTPHIPQNCKNPQKQLRNEAHGDSDCGCDGNGSGVVAAGSKSSDIFVTFQNLHKEISFFLHKPRAYPCRTIVIVFELKFLISLYKYRIYMIKHTYIWR